MTTVQRALFDEVRRIDSVREKANAISMAAAARLISTRLFEQYVALRGPWTGIQGARDAVLLAVDECRSPQEFRMYLCWRLDAELPMPLLNREVYDLDGRLIGIPDLFDEEAGLVGEYQGEDHKDGQRHREDVEREEKFRDHGLEFFEVVGGDLARRQLVVERMLNARASREVPAARVPRMDARAPTLATTPRDRARVPRPHGPRRPALAHLTRRGIPVRFGRSNWLPPPVERTGLPRQRR